jgi:hypothetical protein
MRVLFLCFSVNARFDSLERIFESIESSDSSRLLKNSNGSFFHDVQNSIDNADG